MFPFVVATHPHVTVPLVLSTTRPRDPSGMVQTSIYSRLFTCFVLAVLCGVPPSVNAAGQEDGCSLPPNIRPVVQINGFTSGILFDSSDGFKEAFPDAEMAPGDAQAGLGNVPNLALSLQWNDDLTQQASPIGPESSPDDVLPGFNDPVNAQLKLVRRLVLAYRSG